MSLTLVAAVPSDTSLEQRDRDQRFIRALDTLLSQSGTTQTAGEVVALAGGPDGLMHGNVTDRLLRAGVPSHTADLVVRTVTAAHELTAWWPAERTRVQAPADLAADPVGLLLLEEGSDGSDGSVSLWIACPNFYVITRYNRSPLYAMSVYQLAQAIAAPSRSTRRPCSMPGMLCMP